jgi:NAD(P)-dependent dehydrogenase (short-subunit alcohol dehydrogenase family)
MASTDTSPRPLTDRVALVAGATRGAGRGIARMLGEAGATVYCTGRSSRETGGPASGVYGGRPERIEDTAALVDDAGGRGIAVRVDHASSAEVDALAARLRAEHGRLDILVVDFWGDYAPVAFGTPFWEIPVEAARATLEGTLWPHLVTLRTLVPLLRPPQSDTSGKPPLVVEVAEGTGLHYRGHLYYDLAATTRLRLTYALAEELAGRGIVVVGVCPGYMRTEHALDAFGVTEATWRSAATTDQGWQRSESPGFIGRCVAALAADPEVATRAGRTFGSWELARDYAVDDVDGSRPDFGAYFRAHYGESPLPARTTVRWQVVEGSEKSRS